MKNPPKPAEANLVEEVSKLVKQTEQKLEFIMQHMGRTMYEVLEQRETKKKQEDLHGNLTTKQDLSLRLIPRSFSGPPYTSKEPL